MVYFGGTDPDNLTGMAISACRALPCQVDVVVSPNNPNIEILRKQVQGLDHVTLYGHLPSLAELMARADLAIGAGGATSWERCCLGLPSLVITVAENQNPIAAELNRHGLIRWLGHKNSVTEADLIAALEPLVENGLMAAWSEQCLLLVDGKGAVRVGEILSLESSADLIVKLATRHDETDFVESAQQWPDNQAACWFRHAMRDLTDSRIYRVQTRLGTLLGWTCLQRVGDLWELASNFGTISLTPKIRLLVIQMLISEMRASVIQALRLKSGWSVEGPAWITPFFSKTNAGQKALSLAICSDQGSWINSYLPELIVAALSAGHEVAWVHSAGETPGGDLCFYLSYGRIVDSTTRARYSHNLVVHASDLPQGRGWSPASWLILDGSNKIPVTLLEVVDLVDAGPIYLQEWLELDGTELIEDWHSRLAQKTIELVTLFIKKYPQVLENSRRQVGEPSTYARRRPSDSALDLDESIADQINLLRVVDNISYPAFFVYKGIEYLLKISKR
jgi:hypothetical protein